MKIILKELSKNINHAERTAIKRAMIDQYGWDDPAMAKSSVEAINNSGNLRHIEYSYRETFRKTIYDIYMSSTGNLIVKF